MARIALPWHWTPKTGMPRLVLWACVLIPLPFLAGCAWWRGPSSTPPEITDAGVAARVLVSPDLNVNPTESVVSPGASGQAPSGPSANQSGEPDRTTFGLADAIAFALRNSPRLRSARAAIERARGQERVAFAPFLPQVDFLGQYGVVSATFSPGIPGPEGFILPSTFGTRSYSENEIALEWTIYDFGRTSGRCGQSVAREAITELQLERADQTVEFDVATAYLGVLPARASRRVQEDAVRRAESTLNDTAARHKEGVALREDVLRAQVQLSESREALVLAREREYDSVSRLNNTMGRNAGLPLEVIDIEEQPPMHWALAELLERAATQRPEVRLAREAVAAAEKGREAARGEFLPRVFARAAVGHTDGENVITGWQEGVGLHIDAPLYAGGRHRGELRSAEADIEAGLADAQTILDAISLDVNLAYRGLVATGELIALSRTAVVQAEENLRLERIRYRNGDATPTDIVDGEAALTRSQQRFFSSIYSYLSALARLDYALGEHQGALPPNGQTPGAEQLPLPSPLPPVK
jgi:outer membrane protein